MIKTTRPGTSRRRLRAGALLLTAGLTSVAAHAQAPPCPRPVLARLAVLAGDWKVDWKYRRANELVGVENATATIRAGAGGCALVLQLEGQAGDQRKSILAVLAAPSDDSLQQVYVDSDHGGVLMFTASPPRDTIRFTWSRDMGTHRQIVHLDYFAIGPTGFSTETWMSSNSGVDWILVQQARYRRP